ncbi:hypothetical protein PENTCL1PPCAC_20335, partial [Pristionchus entomophagus]
FDIFVSLFPVCTRKAAFSVTIDGQGARVNCSDANRDIRASCNGCCQSFAAAGGVSMSDAAGFPSSDGRTCVCCVDNRVCAG